MNDHLDDIAVKNCFQRNKTRKRDHRGNRYHVHHNFLILAVMLYLEFKGYIDFSTYFNFKTTLKPGETACKDYL
jgi:hypothetical protein